VEDAKSRYVDQSLTVGTASKLRAAQQRTGQAFIVLDKRGIDEAVTGPSGGDRKRKIAGGVENSGKAKKPKKDTGRAKERVQQTQFSAR